MNTVTEYVNSLIFPAIQDKEILPKNSVRKTEEITTDDLNPDQLRAYNDFVDFYNMDRGGMWLLEGYAGTGKTYLTDRIVEYALSKSANQLIAVAAPTNKAVKVLREAARYKHTMLRYSTIHSLLGLKEMKKGDQVSFVPDKSKPAAISLVKFLIIDEVSQLNDELFEMLLPYVEMFNLKIYFVGDSCQTPPVGKTSCIPLSDEGREQHLIRRSVLNTIVRQGADSPIISLSMQIRKDIHRDYSVVERLSGVVNNSGFFELNPVKSRAYIDSIIKNYFCSDNFKADSDFFKVVAWTNRTVNAYNKKVRGYMFEGMEYGKIMAGEKLIINTPVKEGDVIVFTTNDEVEVKEFTKKTDDIEGTDYKINYYEARVGFIDVQGSERTHILKIVHEDSEELYNKILSLLNDNARKQQPGSLAANIAWSDFWSFKEMYADVAYNYAITTHKAQGSTYHNCMVLEHDIRNNRNVFERNRIFYTAITRAKNILYIVNDSYAG